MVIPAHQFGKSKPGEEISSSFDPQSDPEPAAGAVEQPLWSSVAPTCPVGD